MGVGKRCLLLCCGLATACASSDTSNRPPLVPPAPPQDVVAYAAELLGLAIPPEIPFEHAGIKGMAATFWAESKRVSNARIKADLGVELAYPTYREGLSALMS